jgi:hypothetical protein
MTTRDTHVFFTLNKKREVNPGLPQFSTKIATWEPTTNSWRPASRIHFKLSCNSRHIIAVIYYFNVIENITIQGLENVNPM